MNIINHINVQLMITLPKAFYRVNVIPNKIPISFLTEIDRTILKFIWNYKVSEIVKTILSTKNNIS